MDTAELESKYGITIKAEFVPWSKSRNFDPKKHRTASGDFKVTLGTLNWNVTFMRGGREIITTSYSAGIGHLPCVKNHNTLTHGCKYSILHARYMTHELEKGKESDRREKPILPNASDVMNCLLMDSDAIDYATFEEWASDLGYDTDSRSAERIYHECLKTGLKLRAGLGEQTLKALREDYQDY